MTLNLDVIYRQLLALQAQVSALIAQVKAELPPEGDDGQSERVFGKVRTGGEAQRASR